MEGFASIDDFRKLDLRVGTILSAERIPDADRLLKLAVDFGEGVDSNGVAIYRQVLAGIAPFIPDPAALAGVQCAFVANMAPRTLRGFESDGMLLAANAEDGTFALLCPSRPLPPGTRIR